MNSTEKVLSRCGGVLFILLMALPAVAGSGRPQGRTITPILLEIAGPLNDPRAEVSGMTWHGDTLIVLPQDPTLFADNGQLGFFVIEKDWILAAIDGADTSAIRPRQVACNAPGMSRVVQGFDGLEAIGLIGNRCYMTMEAKGETCMAGYLICGDYDVADGAVVMDLSRVTAIPLGLDIYNLTEETLIVDGERIITLSEANGPRINPRPVGKVFDRNIEYVGTIPAPAIDYRVTDGTALDAERRFWVINYFYPPDRAKLDPVIVPDGCVERLLELQLTRDASGREVIARTDTPPLNLTLLPDGECRNWEAVVRLPGRGFLLMTDQYPGTLLAFVPYLQTDRE